jgi:type II secretory pathway pseudopilin PulG
MSRRRLRGQAGETLAEVMLTIAILGIAAVALLGGIGTAIRLSTVHRSHASADVAITNAAEAVKSATAVSCASLTTSSYSSSFSGIDLPPGWSPSNLSITSATCDSLQLQTIRIRATSPGSNPSVETVDVLKRSP